MFSKEVNELWGDYQKSLCGEEKNCAEANKAENIQHEVIATEEGTNSTTSPTESQDSKADEEDGELVVLGSDGEEQIRRGRRRKNRIRE